jgi:hypothetical protein
MKKEIRTQIYRMTGVFLILCAFALWQYEFVIRAVNSNVLLNMTIIGTFIFGVIVLYRNVFSLGNEVAAFKSLEESYDDVRNGRAQSDIDPHWRLRRCREPGIVFRKPKILGEAYNLVAEQVARKGKIAIDPSTMSTLLEGVDVRFDDQRSLVTYVTGILVMLGLIGTFIGLMATLASVGDIIGGLDLSGGGGSGVIQTLMDNLKKPLKGMATGFSSSLFGLVNSLVLGIMTRFATQASGVLTSNFESWLGGVANLDGDDLEGYGAGGEGTGAQGAGGGLGMEANQLRLLFRVARFSVSSSSRVAKTLEMQSKELEKLEKEQYENRVLLSQMAQSVEKITSQQAHFAYFLDKTADTLSSFNDMAALLHNVDESMTKRFQQVSASLHQVNRTMSTLSHEVREVAAGPVPGDDEVTQLANQLDGLIQVSHLSPEDTKDLKTLAKLYKEYQFPLERLHDKAKVCETAGEPVNRQPDPDPQMAANAQSVRR